ncbi:hypothetical protein HDV05_003056 [Chytridiales sp. JEL 0842]|nr:hypothetical protein HDV05_003056 [Chytridiales sp. JEL 0842]
MEDQVATQFNFLYISDRRHERLSIPNGQSSDELDQQDWRMRERLKTVSVALVLCLNIGIDPPDVVKTSPCAKLECWVDPLSLPPQKALETIGRNLQQQYEVWQPRARYRLSLDPSVEETKKLCCSLRRNAKEERILFHYNGHGVPKPTPGGEIWVFNKNYTQYIPVSIYDIQTWLGSPCIYVFDCSNAGNVLLAFNRFAEQRDREASTKPQQLATNGTADGAAGPTPYVPMRECIQLAACGPNEVLPMNPDLPADVFSCCLTTPIEIALRWFVTQNPLLKNVQPDMIMKIPGRLNDRRTPLGELNWIFTAITDTIAWNVLPHDLFKRLFRQDLMVAALFRNYLLAERIMRYHSCTPMSSPALPSTHQHPMWASWDLAAETCLSQLPGLLRAAEGGPPVEYRHSTFFAEQLTAFEVWLSKGSISKGQPEQLPIVLQVLLSQVHRLRALMLLSRFLDLGPWSVNLALSVGIFPYVLKLLQSPAAELKPVLVFIWAKILAVDRSCQNDLLKDNGFTYFINILTSTNTMPIIPNMSEHRAMCAFILSVFCHSFRAGQEACLKNDLLATLVLHLEDQDPLLRQWVSIGLAKLWEGYSEARQLCISYGIHEKLLPLLSDPVAEVRASAMFAIGNLIQDKYDKPEYQTAIDHIVGLSILTGMADGSPVVRKELVIMLAKVARYNATQISTVAVEIIKEDQRRLASASKSRRISVEPQPSTNGADGGATVNGSRLMQSIYSCVYKSLVTLSVDPIPLLAALASYVVDHIHTNLIATNMISLSKMSLTLTPPKPVISKPTLPPRSETPPPGKGLSASASSTLKRSSSFVNTFKSLPGLAALINSFPIPTTPASEVPSVIVNADTEETTDKKPVDPQSSTPADKLLPLHTSDVQRQYAELIENYQKVAHGQPGALESTFFEWSLEYFAEPQMRVPEMDDPGSMRFNERAWRRERNGKAAAEAVERHQQASIKKFDTQICFLHSDNNPGTLVTFHSFEPHIAGADDTDGIIIYDWRNNTRLSKFSNGNPPGSRITSLQFINEDDVGLFLTGSDEGMIRIYRKYDSASNIELVSGWRALNDNFLSNPRVDLLVDWQQSFGSLLVAGDARTIRIWDVEREMCVQDLPTKSASFVTTLTSEKMTGNLVIGGFADGSLKLYDRRVPTKDSLVMTFHEHHSRLLSAKIQRGDQYDLVSGESAGEVRIWDIRQKKSVRMINAVPPGVQMTALATKDDMDDFDPTADFLAREQAALGADAALFGNPIATTGTTPQTSAFGDFSASEPVDNGVPTSVMGFEQVMTATSATTSNDLFSAAAAFPPVPMTSTSNNNLSMGSPSMSLPPAVPEVESDAVRQWRESFAAAIADRDARAATKHENTLRQAKESLERFYADYNDTKNKAIARNKEQEKALVASLEDNAPSGNVWERVVKQIEVSSTPAYNVSATKLKEKSKGGPNADDKKDEKKKAAAKVKDTSRMKSLLISLKTDKKAPGTAPSTVEA